MMVLLYIPFGDEVCMNFYWYPILSPSDLSTGFLFHSAFVYYTARIE